MCFGSVETSGYHFIYKLDAYCRVHVLVHEMASPRLTTAIVEPQDKICVWNCGIVCGVGGKCC